MSSSQELKHTIHTALQQSRVMLPDLNTFQYIRSEGYGAYKKYSLGGGGLTMLLAEMSVLGFIAKVYYILSKTSNSYITAEDIKAYDEAKGELSGSIAKLTGYLRRPRIGDVNETSAIASLLYAYPIDIGIPRDKNVIAQVWRDLRNRLVHLSQLERDNVAIVGVHAPFIAPDGKVFMGRYEDVATSSREHYKSFRLDKDLELRKALLEKRSEPEWTQLIYQGTSNSVYVDQLLGDIEKMYVWLAERIDEANDADIQRVVEWLQINSVT